MGRQKLKGALFLLTRLICDLQDLRKNWISKKEMDSLKARLKQVEIENLKLKADLDNLYHENLKEVSEMKAENENLKAEIRSMKTTTPSVDRVSEISNSSFQMALPANDTGSDDGESIGDEIQVAGPMLAFYDESTNGIMEDLNSSEIPKSATKRPHQGNVGATVIAKKPKITPDLPPWKCIVCCTRFFKNIRFDTIGELRAHIIEIHPKRSWLCERCPFSSEQKGGLVKHRRLHDANDLKYKGSDQARVCELCNICFGNDVTLSQHYGKYH